ncbi:MAG: CHC2 zinc finger domain-containing protein, partial [Asticcacaulis sp.]
MRFDDHFLDELKTRLRPSEVIGKTVKLRRQGREWVGLSPFTKEKTPSFYVNDTKGQFFDFSSGKNGDIIAFLMETERLPFNEAVERLAREAGMSLPSVTPEAKAADMKKQSLTDWMELAAKWFAARLHDKNPQAQAARDYLKKRGLSDEDVTTFGLGY